MLLVLLVSACTTLRGFAAQLKLASLNEHSVAILAFSEAFFWLWLVVREGRDGMGWGDVLLTPTRKPNGEFLFQRSIHPLMHTYIYIYTHRHKSHDMVDI